jgi:L-ascorbate metabolism protein UlaG (beta-lactamase superfamily)
MDRQAAAELSVEMDPELVVPTHYNTFESIETDSAAFEESLSESDVTVELDEK